jgi:hypothetical protein
VLLRIINNKIAFFNLILIDYLKLRFNLYHSTIWDGAEMTNLTDEEDRRKFLMTCGRFAAVTPPAITLLLSTSLTSDAIAHSGGGSSNAGHSNNGHSNNGNSNNGNSNNGYHHGQYHGPK